METALIVTSVGLLVFLAHLFAGLFEKTRIPDVLPLVFIGLVLGPITGLIDPKAFGMVGEVFTTIALVIILFESGLGLNITVLRRSMLRATRLTVINFIGAMAVVAALAVWKLQASWLEGLVLGAALGATAPAVVLPMVSRLPLSQGTRTTLILESIFGEGLCIILTLALIQAVLSTEVNVTLMLGELIASFTLASVIGGGAAYLWSNALHRIRELENSRFTTPAFVFIVFGIAEMLGYAGPIAAFAFGIVLGNIKRLELPSLEKEAMPQLIGLSQTEKAFFAEVVFLLKTFFFVYIGISARLHDISFIVVGLIFTVALFLVRLPSVYVAMDKKCACNEAPLVAAMAPRGLAAAVLASIILQANLPNAVVMNELVYIVITISVIATTMLTFLQERTFVGSLMTGLFFNFAPAKASEKKNGENDENSEEKKKSADKPSDRKSAKKS